jgi:hypothetical protein
MPSQEGFAQGIHVIIENRDQIPCHIAFEGNLVLNQGAYTSYTVGISFRLANRDIKRRLWYELSVKSRAAVR